MDTRKLISVGRSYKELTITKVYEDSGKRSKCQCQCVCGNITDVYNDELVSGRKTTCHDPKLKTLMNKDSRLIIEEALDLNTTIRVIQRYIKYGLSIQQRAKRCEELTKAVVPNSIDEMEIGDTLSHFTLMEKSVFEGEYQNTHQVMSLFLCECGKTIFVSDRAIKKHNHLRCRCDVHMDGHLSRRKLTRKKFDLQICRHGPNKEGICIYYNGDDGCLADQAFRNMDQPTRFRAKYTCYCYDDDRPIKGGSPRLVRGAPHRHMFEG